ncbi:type II toxin-antitoxin system mRNA interferase toxin, RelE/StbE family [Microcoleus sp. LEGE 07076]|uniref:type II toxin-antitoxin system RelE/ParE family toxin n=1 Tax=Microcoleus sp. LEGE 07076 TaxID=915322 RepID=UPI00187F3939|nr:type II toxin-antitoxin system mRNA interferase toxin, RelE/StbE family [Microcoleus sp. LEGE 07076]MBE9188738.1 type II toxin-antitoxin system mRNA interferase toxin, RelE/StbE family [Microcoleus sp. LEGE 07076]
MKTITFAPSFKRAYKALISKHPDLQPKVEDVLRFLAENSFDPSPQTHKLKGQLAGSWACTVEYDCRIVFDFIQNPELPDEEILLLDIGSHDEVY